MSKTKTLILQMRDKGERKITIPEDWVVTFGPVAVGARHDVDGSTHVLRLYSDTGKKQLKAVFRNVVMFHEEGIEILEKVVRKKNKTFKRDEANGEQTYAAEIRQTTWRDPYADEQEDDEFDLKEDALALPKAVDF